MGHHHVRCATRQKDGAATSWRPLPGGFPLLALKGVSHSASRYLAQVGCTGKKPHDGISALCRPLGGFPSTGSGSQPAVCCPGKSRGGAEGAPGPMGRNGTSGRVEEPRTNE